MSLKAYTNDTAERCFSCSHWAVRRLQSSLLSVTRFAGDSAFAASRPTSLLSPCISDLMLHSLHLNILTFMSFITDSFSLQSEQKVDVSSHMHNPAIERHSQFASLKLESEHDICITVGILAHFSRRPTRLFKYIRC